MIDLTKNQKGKLGNDIFFSDLFGAALNQSYTGAIWIKTSDREGAVFFERGSAIHASGTLLQEHLLGQLLVIEGALEPEPLEAALAEQGEMAPEVRKPVGELLLQGNHLTLPVLQMAMSTQITKRIQKLFGLTYGNYQTSPGTFPQIEKVAVLVDSWPILLGGLAEHGSSKELTKVSDDFLGKAVANNAPTDITNKLLPGEVEKKALSLLERAPRKPKELERKLKDRNRVRALLKSLSVIGCLELKPESAGRPIVDKKKAKAVKARQESAVKKKAAPPVKGGKPAAPQRRESSIAAKPKAPQGAQLVREFYDKLHTLNYFQMFDLDPKADIDPGDLRRRLAVALKKYHPDALHGADEALQTMARDISAQFNAAYGTLTDTAKWAEYRTAILNGTTPMDENSQSRAKAAETKLEMARVHIRKKEYKRARELLKMALDMNPNSAQIKAHYGWAHWADTTLDRKKAVEKAGPLFLEAYEVEKKDAYICYYVGMLMKEKGELDKASRLFQKAARLDRRLKEAASEARLLQMRKSKDSDGGGKKSGLGRFFKFGS